MQNLWSSRFTVRAGEADLFGRASVKTLFQYLEETAYHHAEQLGFSYSHMKAKGAYWVLFRLRLEMDRYPQWAETVEIETWTRGFVRLLARRDFLIKDPDSRVLGRAASQWLLLSIANKRPIRPETIFTHPMPDPGRRALSIDPGPSPQAKVYELCHPVISRYTDLDVNRHVNNTRYVEWALNCMPASWYENKLIRTFQMEYLDETQDQCAVRLEKAAINSTSQVIRAVREDTAKTVFHSLMEWE
jgi:medium-chain acyl-[acyl-carrier-protein] hydrolase